LVVVGIEFTLLHYIIVAVLEVLVEVPGVVLDAEDDF
jgi:hypothetical protein